MIITLYFIYMEDSDTMIGPARGELKTRISSVASPRETTHGRHVAHLRVEPSRESSGGGGSVGSAYEDAPELDEAVFQADREQPILVFSVVEGGPR